MNPMFAYVPSNLEFSSQKHRDKYYSIITFIYYGRVFDKRRTSASFIQLYSPFLKSIINGRYKDYLQDLMDMRVIETDNRYIKKTKSKAYRLTENYRNIKTRQVRIVDEKIIANYWNYKRAQKMKLSEIHLEYLFECLEKIDILYESAKAIIESTAQDLEQYNSWNISIDMIHSKDWFFVVDKTAGRVHNNITNLPKNIRPFLRVNDQKLVEIDVANSQPLFFNILINRYLFRYTDIGGKYLPYVPQNSDLILYKELTEHGRFYEYMMEKLGVTEERSLFKVRLFINIFYGREIENKDRKLFDKLFPEVSKIISYYKKVNYKNLAIELQRIEAEMMINSVVPILAEGKIFVLTIHDSVLTTLENAEKVKNVIIEVFKKFNLHPTLKIKN